MRERHDRSQVRLRLLLREQQAGDAGVVPALGVGHLRRLGENQNNHAEKSPQNSGESSQARQDYLADFVPERPTASLGLSSPDCDRNIQALLRSEEKPEPAISVSEPAGSEAAKFRLWVKSKGLALSRPEGGMEEEEEGGVMLDTPLLFVPTGTDKVSQPSPP